MRKHKRFKYSHHTIWLTMLFLNGLAVTAFAINANAHALENASVLVSKARSFSELTDAFRSQYEGWIGADGAYSIPLNQSITLWTFGDTWIGKIENNNRKPDCQFINNSVAVQLTNKNSALRPMSFNWLSHGVHAASVWTPEKDDCYFWPGDGIAFDGKLYVFLHKITTDKTRQEPFQFRTVSDSIVLVENPMDAVDRWKMKFVSLENDAENFEYGTATTSDDAYVYIYCSAINLRNGINLHPAVLARISKQQMRDLNFAGLEYYQSTSNAKSKWVKEKSKATIMFADAAPEMTVTKVDGIPGFVAVYMPPLSKEIFIRCAPRPEGPWGQRIKIYDCPEKDDGIILYSAKAHQELARAPRELIVTYCRNSKDNKKHYTDASIYYPQAIAVELKTSAK